MQLALVSQDFRTTVHWEEELQTQYRLVFLNLVNIYLDSLVQQKIIDEEQKNKMSTEFNDRLKTTENEWKDRIADAVQV